MRVARLRAGSPRVFCIGWHKTGTTTLGLALLKLGYSVLGCRLDMVHPLRRNDLVQVLDLAGKFDALQDVPWACLYRDLDRRYPGSKFILTVRDESSWLRSASRHFGNAHIPLHEWIYGRGNLCGNEQLYLQKFRNHQEAVMDYFSDRPDDLLIFSLARGDGWRELCEFLDVGVPEMAFPHENKSPSRRNWKERIHHRIRALTPSLIRKGVFSLRLKLRASRGLPDPRNRFNNFPENRDERRSWSSHSEIDRS